MERLAWEACEPYQETVNTLARMYAGRSGSEFDDLVQEGWECVCAKLQEHLIPTAEDIERWMRSYIRQLERLHKGDSTAPFTYGGTPTKPDVQLHIREKIGSLPPELATVVLMYGFGYNFQEIGNHLGIHRTTASVWFRDACIKLRRTL